MVARVRESSDMQAAVRAFLELGNERNRLVHQNYATFAMEKTLDEVYELYRRSIAFVEALPGAFYGWGWPRRCVDESGRDDGARCGR